MKLVGKVLLFLITWVLITTVLTFIGTVLGLRIVPTNAYSGIALIITGVFTYQANKKRMTPEEHFYEMQLSPEAKREQRERATKALRETDLQFQRDQKASAEEEDDIPFGPVRSTASASGFAPHAAYDPNYGWTEFWQWARAHGVNDRKQVEKILGYSSSNLTPAEIRQRLGERIGL